MAYSLDALRRSREPKAATAPAAASLKEVPPDAPHATDDALGCWNGEAFVSWSDWTLSQRKRPGKELRENHRATDTDTTGVPQVLRVLKASPTKHHS
jgi:hypothetical protein